MMFSFNLRKDIGQKVQASNLQSLGNSIKLTNTNTQIQANNMFKARQYVNTLINVDTKTNMNINSINETLTEKIDIEDLHTNVIETIVNNDTILETKLHTTMENALNSINTHKEKAIEDINIHYYNAITNGNGPSNGNGSSNGNYVSKTEFLNISDKLLKKIDYLFEMFYHADSDIIMENYPLANI